MIYFYVRVDKMIMILEGLYNNYKLNERSFQNSYFIVSVVTANISI